MFHQHKALCTITGKVSELNKMVLFCTVYMKSLKWIQVNNCWLKKCEKSVTDVRKGQEWKGDFLVKSSNVLITMGNLLHYLILFLPIKTRLLYIFMNWKCGQLSHNYIKCDLGDPNFTFTTIVIPLFLVLPRLTTSASYIYKLGTYTRL